MKRSKRKPYWVTTSDPLTPEHGALLAKQLIYRDINFSILTCSNPECGARHFLVARTVPASSLPDMVEWKEYMA